MKKRDDTLKLIAMFTMLIDHIGATFFKQAIWMRLIGRIAFPIFVWHVVEGYNRTSNIEKYIKRLILLAIISQPIYMMFNDLNRFKILHLNVIFLLLLCIIVIYGYDKYIENKKNKNYAHAFLWGILFIGLILAPDFIKMNFEGFKLSYGSYGLLIAMIFHTQKNLRNQMVCYLILSIAMIYVKGIDLALLQAFSLFSLPIIHILKDKNLNFKIKKQRAYIFYPLHMLFIYLIYIVIK